MKITFNIAYRTNWGESVYIISAMGKARFNKATEPEMLNYSNANIWSITKETEDVKGDLYFRFVIKNGDKVIREEWGEPHHITLSNACKNYIVNAKWNDIPADKHYYSSAFTNGIFNRNRDKAIKSSLTAGIKFSADFANLKSNEVIAISGSCPELGNWDLNKAIVMNDANFPKWEAFVAIESDLTSVAYKFVILNKDTKELIQWENAANHELQLPDNMAESLVNVEESYINFPRNQWRGAGTAIPVFSLRSNDDCGVGDFYDLFGMIDWAVSTGQNFVQVLPINDTTMTHTWTDSYPYNANSTFALHPMYIRLEAVGKLTHKTKLAEFKKIKSELNALPTVDYERVNEYKIGYLKQVFEKVGKETLESDDYHKFVKDNAFWLHDYAAFCVLRDKYSTPDFSKWEEYAKYDKKAVAKFAADNATNISFVCFIQYHLSKQLTEVRNYAHSKGVVLKGDIPIGISRTSVDAWVNPRLFNLDCQAGAPPDDFSVNGQNWGFPTYNWEEMAKDGYQWWKARFANMAQYFDAYRIDHILGFFRIWEIPYSSIHGLMGYFNPALPFTADELRTKYDFWVNDEAHTMPYIHEYMLTDFFGEFSDEAKQYLNDTGNGTYSVKPEFNTQRKIEKHFASINDTDVRNQRIRDGLMGLLDQVLFIKDKSEQHKYHPRIAAQSTYVYRALSEYEKWCFNRLYNDFFYHRHNEFWYARAMEKLPALINSTNMLVCGEDLGMIPSCVASVMQSQQILSLEIQRMPKDPKLEFGITQYYPYRAVATTSTHDMNGIRGWWEEDHDKSQRFFNNILHEHGAAPVYAEPWICEKILASHIASPSMLVIIPLQDWLSIDGSIRRENPADEQINIPAISRHYWRYRMHITLEDLMANSEFNRHLTSLIKSNGR